MKELIYGKNSVIDALKKGIPIKAVYTARISEIKNLNISQKVEVIETKKHILDSMTHENHQGFVAEVKEFNYYSLDCIFKDKPKKVLILDRIQDPRNLGAIIRSANGAGLKHIIIPKNRATKVTSTSLKVSSGGFLGMKIIRVNSLIDCISKLRNNSFWIYASGLQKDALSINDATFNYPLAVILGNEEKGVSQTLLKHCDQKFYIPMKGTVQSLNVSVAAGVILFKI